MTLADVVEIYHRSGGVDAAVAVARERRGTQFDPGLVDVFCAEAPALFDDIDSATTWHAVIEAEPALEIVLSDAELESALEAIADFTDLKSPVDDRPLARGGRPRARGRDALRALRRRRDARAPGGPGARPRPPGRLQRDLGQAGSAHPHRARAGAPASVPDRADARVLGRAGAARGDRGPAPRAPRRLGLSPRALRRRADAGRAGPRGGRRLPRDDRAAAPPRGARRRRRPRRSCAPASGEALFDGDAADAVLRAAGHASQAPARVARGPHEPRGRGPAGCSCAACRTRRSPSSS